MFKKYIYKYNIYIDIDIDIFIKKISTELQIPHLPSHKTMDSMCFAIADDRFALLSNLGLEGEKYVQDKTW